MKTKLFASTLVLIAAVGLSSSAWAQVFDWHEANSFGWADKNNQKHPVKKTLGLLIPEKYNNDSSACIWYLNNHAKENKGKVTTSCELTRQDLSVEKFKFNDKVQDNWVCDCKTTGPVAVGDALMCSFKMKGFAKLKATQDDWNYVDLAVAIVPGGEGDWCR